ncbi:twin-arginine translocase TatA/TatE family subunit [Xanthobacter dioxanivorans]|uniref:Sec-independent protein translocase protein TatA n=1 Tax=Xanthobacter dioxanivorans TaxID=2528964 RepID=A0A974PKA2_9HYPH|nr:twin-arginine translocase TatA/TatE family subunit [Xanthobacter dioxanivorans]QRG05147.1 twin-arginine translocase TatA/TatE family subunit [Xanthobacter dioxanivorans]
MGSLSIWHWIVVLAVVLLLFGRGKISDLMGDVAKGIKSFKKGLAEDDEPAKTPAAPPEAPRPLSSQTTSAAEAEKKPV